MKVIRITVLALIISIPGFAAEDVTSSGTTITPYLWLPARVDVDSTVDGDTTTIDIDLGDILDNFDVFSVAGRSETWWKQWGIITDAMWVDLDSKGTDGPVPEIRDINVDNNEGTFDLLAAYRMALGENGSARLFAGGRYHYLKQEITLTLTGPAPDEKLGGSKDWVEPVIGAQFIQRFAERWTATARGDLGGFGIGSASDLTANVAAGIGYDTSENWSVKLGYRYYYIDYMNGRGSKAFGLEGEMHGPWLGFSYKL